MPNSVKAIKHKYAPFDWDNNGAKYGEVWGSMGTRLVLSTWLTVDVPAWSILQPRAGCRYALVAEVALPGAASAQAPSMGTRVRIYSAHFEVRMRRHQTLTDIMGARCVLTVLHVCRCFAGS